MVSIGSLLRRRRRTLYLYGDESGDLHQAPYFILGILTARNPTRHDTQVNNLRREHRYHRELKYSNTDRHKESFAKAIVDYFWSEPDLRFHAWVIDNAEHDLQHFKKFRALKRPQDVAYNYWYKKLILRCTPPRDALVIHLDQRTRAKEDNLPEYLEEEVPRLKSLQLVDSSKHQLVQVADLLTGSIYGDLTKVGNSVKRNVVYHLRKHVGGSLTARHLSEDQKFCVAVWRPPRRD